MCPREHASACRHRRGVEAHHAPACTPTAMEVSKEGSECGLRGGEGALERAVRGFEEELGFGVFQGHRKRELLGEVREAAHGARGVRVEAACVEDPCEAGEHGSGEHGGDEVAVGPEDGLVFFFFVIVIVGGGGAGRGAGVFV